MRPEAILFDCCESDEVGDGIGLPGLIHRLHSGKAEARFPVAEDLRGDGRGHGPENTQCLQS